MKQRKSGLIAVVLLLVCVMVFNFTGCSAPAQAADLMEGIKAKPVSEKNADDDFVSSQMRLSVELFRSAVLESPERNVLISPLSIQLALAMTANGADGETLAEMEKLLGGDIPIEELNEYLRTYVNSLPSDDKYKLEIANSIWFRDNEDRLSVEKDFLQTNADYYGAQIYRSSFDGDSIRDINNWVEEHTDGMIDKIVDMIDPDTLMYLINALMFDADWEKAYDSTDVSEGAFTALSGDKRTVKMMSSTESKYLNDGSAAGFVKDYKDGKYSFAALLPNKGVDIREYIAGLTGESLLSTLSGVQNGTVLATMPKFSYEYELSMNGILADLGMPSAFSGSKADFSRMASSSENIYIGDVLHKTFISVDELGTEAAAVTKVDVRATGAFVADWEVYINRPFVCIILDNSTGLPVFIGAVTDIAE